MFLKKTSCQIFAYATVMTFPAQNAEINIIVRYDFSIQTMFAVVCRRAHISFTLFVLVCLYAM